MLKKILEERTPTGKRISVEGHDVLVFSAGLLKPYAGLVQCEDLEDYLKSYERICQAIEGHREDFGKMGALKTAMALLRPTDDNILGGFDYYGFEIQYAELGEDHDTSKEIRIPGMVGYHPILVQGERILECTYGLRCIDDMFMVGEYVKVIGEPIFGRGIKPHFDIQIMERADD